MLQVQYIRCAMSDYGCYNVTEPPIDAPRDPLYRSEREISKVHVEPYLSHTLISKQSIQTDLVWFSSYSFCYKCLHYAGFLDKALSEQKDERPRVCARSWRDLCYWFQDKVNHQSQSSGMTHCYLPIYLGIINKFSFVSLGTNLNRRL